MIEFKLLDRHHSPHLTSPLRPNHTTPHHRWNFDFVLLVPTGASLKCSDMCVLVEMGVCVESVTANELTLPTSPKPRARITGGAAARVFHGAFVRRHCYWAVIRIGRAGVSPEAIAAIRV